jgi:hypothetical protein
MNGQPIRLVTRGEARDAAIEDLRAMATAQSALIFALLTVLQETRVVPRTELRAVLETALEMVENVGRGMPGQAPRGLEGARSWLQELLDDMPPAWTS